MGVLTDLILASVDEADAVAHAEVPGERWPALDMKGHTSVTFGELVAIVRGVDYDLELFDIELLAQGTEEGPWVTLVPAGFVSELAELADDRLAPVATAWASTDELDGWTAEEAADALHRLRDFCRRARDAGSTMLMWNVA